ncbi:MAG: NUDIX domain-containing protein [Patescibacteria group bacterium]|nr:NUDIX domain-containing protein [Patescibacteria group bacterium]
MAEDKQFFVGQKAFIRKGDEVLVLFDPRIGLDFPGGKIQEGENDFDEALRREVREETGLEIEIGAPFHRWYFEFGAGHRNAGKQVFLVGFKCAYRSGEIKLSDEHDSFRWVSKDTYRELDRGDGDEYFRALEKYFEDQRVNPGNK